MTLPRAPSFGTLSSLPLVIVGWDISDNLYIGPVTALVCSQTPVLTHPNSCPRLHLHSGALWLYWAVATPTAASWMPLFRGPLNASKPAHPSLCSAISFLQFLVLAISSPSCPRSLARAPSSPHPRGLLQCTNPSSPCLRPRGPQLNPSLLTILPRAPSYTCNKALFSSVHLQVSTPLSGVL